MSAPSSRIARCRSGSRRYTRCKHDNNRQNAADEGPAATGEERDPQSQNNDGNGRDDEGLDAAARIRLDELEDGRDDAEDTTDGRESSVAGDLK
ncbi:hypothetical protein Aab01nite_70930 [Paractinoplanes abujensis]|nr:hypothetical protein Aab01nite_70930 [Actinoplanes abujensis]